MNGQLEVQGSSSTTVKAWSVAQYITCWQPSNTNCYTLHYNLRFYKHSCKDTEQVESLQNTVANSQ